MSATSETLTIPADLDHVVFAGPSLSEAIDAVEQLTGVRAAPGGKHPTGTANALIAFTVKGERVPHYLEVIGPDPDGDIPASEISTFSIADRSAPAIATFAIHPADIEAAAAAAAEAGVSLGEILPLSRKTPEGTLLEWRLTRGENRDPNPAIPFLIDWGTTPHPGHSDIPTIELLGVRITSPEAEKVRSALAALGAEIEVNDGEAFSLTLVLEGANGVVELV